MTPAELRQIAVLQALDEAALAGLASALEECSYAEGATIFAEGDPGDAMFFISTGAVRVEKQTGSGASSRKVLSVLEAGNHFGEMSLFDQQPRSAAAIAATPTRLLRLSRSAFTALLGRSSEAGMSVLFGMIRTGSERIRWLSSQLVVYDEIGKAIGEARSLGDLLDVVLHQLGLATQADWGLLLLKSRFGSGLVLRSVEGLNLTRAQQDALADGGGFLAPLLAAQREAVVKDVDEEEPFKSCARLGFELPSLLVTPITTGDQLLGIIALGCRETGHFTPNHLNLVRGVARQAGQAILNALHREEEEARSRHSRQFVRF
jgi:CRP-like cAMP-binding protein/putative methionine-R-sulfoxide reductase with GAF domain